VNIKKYLKSERFITLQQRFDSIHFMLKHLRHIENFHIVLWLIKDSCWLVHFKTGGVVMVIPTIGMAVYLAVKTRKQMHLLLPNLSVCAWICANATWMLGEFFDFNHIPLALAFFLSGIAIITHYFIRYSKVPENN
jgi:hypothetical protein